MNENSTTIDPKNNADSIPRLLSNLLRHPDLPDRLSEPILAALNDMYNEGISSEHRYTIETSPEYLKMLIHGCEDKEEETPAVDYGPLAEDLLFDA